MTIPVNSQSDFLGMENLFDLKSEYMQAKNPLTYVAPKKIGNRSSNSITAMYYIYMIYSHIIV